MIYTCYEMSRDCRADRPEGWAYFISNYVPAIRKLVAHYAAGDEKVLESVLRALRKPGSSLFQTLEEVPERWFLAELRQKVMVELVTQTPEIGIDLETVASALEPLTMVEKQAAWMETMRYQPAQIGPMLRMAPATVEKIRERAADLVRGKVDQWNRNLLADNGAELGRSAAAAGTNDCLTPKTFLDILDGRMTWRGREQLEHHVNACWHCIDHFSRMAEVVELLRGLQPLTEQEARPYRALLGVQAPKRPVWKRFMGGS
ncbi:MAG TPA: hypothetical protein VKU19_01930 [Bryobacteraceae bacterium]|nr:hypothetical protein [Bryobacteraceae bacterium]